MLSFHRLLISLITYKKQQWDFFQIRGIPQIIGIVDGTLINIDAPTEHEEAFIDRHGNHSLNCMVICGPNMMFY
jgi:hypothetical protein